MLLVEYSEYSVYNRPLVARCFLFRIHHKDCVLFPVDWRRLFFRNTAHPGVFHLGNIYASVILKYDGHVLCRKGRKRIASLPRGIQHQPNLRLQSAKRQFEAQWQNKFQKLPTQEDWHAYICITAYTLPAFGGKY